MLAAYAASFDADNPLEGLVVGDLPEPQPQEDWVPVTVKAAAINHHDLWSLRGVGLKAEQLPMTLGTDAAGLDPDGNPVVVHAVISTPGWTGDDTLDPRRTLFSEKHQGTFSETVLVPRRNLVAKPEWLSFEEAACVPTAWLTAYRMLFTRGRCLPGQTVLVQGAGGGVSSALIALARAAGLRVWVTTRSEAKGEHARELGAHEVYASGERLPAQVDSVMETVGRATWEHSIRSLRPGGTMVISGTTSGGQLDDPLLAHVFFRQLSVVGSTMGTKGELTDLLAMLESTGLRPGIHDTLPLAEARRALEIVESGDVTGKVVLTP